MKNKGLIATIVVLVAIIITLVAVVFLMQMPTIMSVEGYSNKSASKKETSIISTIETVESTKESETETTTIPVLKKTTRIENYVAKNSHVKIDYPVIEGMEDEELQARINEKIKTNALSIVPLYPISTAMQNLEVSCEIKLFNDDYITIIYEGRVVGKTNSTTTSSTGNTGKKKISNNKSATKDPYLDGFVDPLGIYGQMGNSNIFQTPEMTYSITAPSIDYSVEVSKESQSQKFSSGDNVWTSDTGPSVSVIHSPTAPSNNTSDDTYSNQVSGFSSTKTVDQKIFFTNTVDLKTGLDVSLKEYVSDLEKLSKWLRSSKVEFVNVDESNRKVVREYINLTVQSRYLTQMKNADFQNKGLDSWPKIFSYRDSDGVVYFSVKLSSKLGNYAIVKYNP